MLKFSRMGWSKIFLMTLLLVAVAGCRTTPKPPKPVARAIRISAAGQAANLTIKVYVGVANSMYAKDLMERNVDLFLKDAPQSQVEFKTFELTSEAVEIKKTDPIWNVWLRQKKGDHLVVIANLPLNYGGGEKRRVNIPLDKRVWKHLPSKQPIRVEIRENGVQLLDNPSF